MNHLQAVAAEAVLEVVDVGNNVFIQGAKIVFPPFRRHRGMLVVAEHPVAVGGIEEL